MGKVATCASRDATPRDRSTFRGPAPVYLPVAHSFARTAALAARHRMTRTGLGTCLSLAIATGVRAVARHSGACFGSRSGVFDPVSSRHSHCLRTRSARGDFGGAPVSDRSGQFVRNRHRVRCAGVPPEDASHRRSRSRPTLLALRRPPSATPRRYDRSAVFPNRSARARGCARHESEPASSALLCNASSADAAVRCSRVSLGTIMRVPSGAYELGTSPRM
jgi:hypothetical protein